MRPDAYYHYDLVGVVVHSGTAFAGHYYSYIKERDGDKPFGSKDPNSNG
jgi:ubiquitin C-terminal hydrolase